MPVNKIIRFSALLYTCLAYPLLLPAQNIIDSLQFAPLQAPVNAAYQPPVKPMHIKNFGAIANGRFDCTPAFQKASAYLQQYGGTLIIDPGIYIVGRQRFAKSYYAAGSYFNEPVLDFRYAKYPIVVLGYKATLKAANGLKYGSFNPVSGQKDSLRKTGNTSDYFASAYTLITGIGCASLTVKGLTLDGNSANLDIGPGFGKEGIQLSASGISFFNNKKVLIADCYIHHCALDAIIIAWPGLKNSDPIYPHTIHNVKATYNGRQGLSWVGGNSLTVTNSSFSSTGRALNKGVPVVSKPSAGIDIEIENSIIKNGSFINCTVYDNAGPGLSTIGHDTYNINFKKVTFIGTTNSAAYPKSQGLSFDSCTFAGKVERIFGSADKTKAIAFKNCLFTMDKKLSPGGKIFAKACEFYEGQNVIFDQCTFNSDTVRLPVFNYQEIVFLNCKFYQHSDIDFNASASFKGNTQFMMKGKGKVITSEARFEGKILYNNKNVVNLKNPQLE